MSYEASYDNNNIVNGRIQGKVPQYIKSEENGVFKPVIYMTSTFSNCTNLVVTPTIPTTVTAMPKTYEGCRKLEVSANIPNTVQIMDATFKDCSKLLTVAKLSSNLTEGIDLFYGCTNLRTVPTIPSHVTNLTRAFYGCEKLTGNLAINATGLTTYANCFTGAATAEGTSLVLSGNAGETMLNNLKGTAGAESHISVE